MQALQGDHSYCNERSSWLREPNVQKWIDGNTVLTYYNIGSLLVLKKGHPCGENLWEVVKLGADIRLKCTKCGRLVIIPRIELNKKIKRVKEKEK